MNASDLTKLLLRNKRWAELFLDWQHAGGKDKDFAQFTAMCLGKTCVWFEKVMEEEEAFQVSAMRWTAGALIKQLKGQK